jgi:hypothetical protein
MVCQNSYNCKGYDVIPAYSVDIESKTSGARSWAGTTSNDLKDLIGKVEYVYDNDAFDDVRII